MRMTVIHDDSGNIEVLGVAPAAAPRSCPQARAGRHVTEIDVPASLGLKLDDPQINRRLSEIMATHRVGMATGARSLVKRK